MGKNFTDDGDYGSVLSCLPKTRYFGSKRRHSPWLLREFSAIDRGVVLDYFGGTGTTSLLLKSLGFDVIYNDIFLFNRVLARAIFMEGLSPISNRELKAFIDSVEPEDGFIFKTFGGMYFTDFENRWLDGILKKIFRIRIQEKRDILLYCLAQACLSKRPFNLFHRANLNLRVNHAGSSFGNKTTWEKQFGEHMLHAYKQLENAWHIRGGAVSVMDPGRLSSRKNNRVEILYLDPPYIRSDRCHESYLLRYHFLEGMVMYPEWGGVIDAGSSIKSLRTDLYKDEWRTESDFINGIEGMLNLFNPRCVCVSYAENSKPSVSVIRDILEYHGAKTQVSMKPYKSSLSKNQRSEFFIKGEFK